MKNASSGLLIAALLGTTTAAFAVPTTLPIDFRGAGWSGADNQAVFSVGGVTASALPSGARLQQSAVYGLGVDSSIPFIEDPNEVGPGEQLVIQFAAPRALTGTWLTKLFDEVVDDAGSVSLFTGVTPAGTWNFIGTASGEKYVDFGAAILADKVVFKGDAFTGRFGRDVLIAAANRDFSVAGFTTPSRVPDAGAPLVMLTGSLLGLALACRTRAGR